MGKYFDIISYNVKKDEKFLLDANILLYLFYTAGNYNRDMVRKYATFYFNIVSVGAKIILPINLISEFSNRIFKLGYKDYLATKSLDTKQFSYKQFRQTVEFENTIKEIYNIFEGDILPYVDEVDYTYKGRGLSHFLSTILDFNDIIYCDLAKEFNAAIITHDEDFKNLDDIKVVTANSKLLHN